jgi:tRNA-intron endonuclease, archaea type
MAKAKKKSVKAVESETLTEEQFVVENPDLSTELETIVPAKFEGSKKEKLAIDEAGDNNNNKKSKKKVLVKAILGGEKAITESSDEARLLYNQSRFGSLIENGKVELSLLETLYLFEKGKLDLRSEAGRKMKFNTYVKRARKVEPNFWVRYCVFKDIRNRGYIIKTALKFGADFRVYDRGIKPGEDHARWIVYPVHEGETLTWYEFAAKNRVAHSTKKRLLMGIVDDEGDVTYYEIRWLRP